MGDLRQLMKRVKLKCSKREIQWKASPTYGVRTRYVRTVYMASAETSESTLTPLLRRGSFNDTSSVEGKMPSQSVYMLCDGGAANNAYSWLSVADFEHLKSANGGKVLSQWMESLDISHVPGNMQGLPFDDVPQRTSSSRTLKGDFIGKQPMSRMKSFTEGWSKKRTVDFSDQGHSLHSDD